MTAKQYLSQARYLQPRINAKMEQIQQLRALAEKRTANYGPSPGGGSSPDRRMDIAARMIDMERELDAEIDRYIDLQREIADVINRVGDQRLCALLELRYLNGCKWAVIARRMHYSYDNVQRLHAAALRKVAAILKLYTK